MAALPLTGLTIGMVSQALGVGSSDVGTLCSSNRINKWSKRKPTPDYAVAKDSPMYWRDSPYSQNIRNGFEIVTAGGINYCWSEIPWIYRPELSVDDCHRLGDFRGYDPAATGHIFQTFVDSQIKPIDMIPGLDFWTNINIRCSPNSTGSTSAQDVFFLDAKYCYPVCKITNIGNHFQKILGNIDPSIEMLGDRITGEASLSYYYYEFHFTYDQMTALVGSGGTLYIEFYFLESNFDLTGSGFTIINDDSTYHTIHQTRFSIRDSKFANTLFIQQGLLSANYVFTNVYTDDMYGNNTDMEPTYDFSTGKLTPSSATIVTVDSADRAGGAVSGYTFAARILSKSTWLNASGSTTINQAAATPNAYTYLLPNHTLAANDTYTWNIPSFELFAEDKEDVVIEYSLWSGTAFEGVPVNRYIYYPGLDSKY